MLFADITKIYNNNACTSSEYFWVLLKTSSELVSKLRYKKCKNGYQPKKKDKTFSTSYLSYQIRNPRKIWSLKLPNTKNLLPRDCRIYQTLNSYENLWLQIVNCAHYANTSSAKQKYIFFCLLGIYMASLADYIVIGA